MSDRKRDRVSLRSRTTIRRILALSLVIGILVPFPPIIWFTWSGYLDDVERAEREIQDTNHQVAYLAARRLEDFLRDVQREATLSAKPGTRLPQGPPGVKWESVDGSGNVKSSQVDPERIGRASGYRPFLDSTAVSERSVLSGVGEWLDGQVTTVLYVARMDDESAFLVGVLDSQLLHDDLTAWSGPLLDRHVYVVDDAGRLVFYSDIAVSRVGRDLTGNPPIRMHLAGEEGRVRYVSVVSGKERLGFVVRVPSSDWGVIVSADIGSRLVGLRNRYAALGWAIGFALISAILILLWTYRRVTRPLFQIRDALRMEDRLVGGALPVPETVRRVVEYRELVEAHDDLSGRLAKAQQRLVQAERAELLGQLSTGIAHEIGTPLNVMSGNAQYRLRKIGADDPSRATLQQVVRQVERISQMVRRFLDFARTSEPRREKVDMVQLVNSALDLIPGTAREVQIHVDASGISHQVFGDPKLLEHVLLNLLVNACQAMPDGGELKINVGHADDRTESFVSCSVTDTGCGIPEDRTGRVFEPFYSTKPPGEGTGLGLAIVDRIVKQHGGTIEVVSREGIGSTFTIRLPRSELNDGGGHRDG